MFSQILKIWENWFLWDFPPLLVSLTLEHQQRQEKASSGGSATGALAKQKIVLQNFEADSSLYEVHFWDTTTKGYKPMLIAPFNVNIPQLTTQAVTFSDKASVPNYVHLIDMNIDKFSKAFLQKYK